MSSIVYVGLPVLSHTQRFHFDRGRRWTAVEHLILQSLVRQPYTAGQLATEGCLPRRVILEVLIRLMRAGWVELRAGTKEVTFHATKRGIDVSSQEELPTIKERMARRMSYVVDLVTGSVFRRRDLTLLRHEDWANRTQGRRTVVIEKPEVLADDIGHVSSLLDALFDEDEQLIRVDTSDWPPIERLALFPVRENLVEGLPRRTSPGFREMLVKASNMAPKRVEDGRGVPSVKVSPMPAQLVRPERTTNFRQDDIIRGGEAHGQHIRGLLRKARRQVVIHSTFLDCARFEDLMPDFRVATSRGAHIDILWGQNSRDAGAAKSLQEAAAIEDRISKAGLSGLCTVHHFSTRSHAKLLIADDGAGRFSATIGSCNWLSSPFSSLEVSVRLRDQRLVGDVLFEAAEIARPQDGNLPELSVQLAQLASELQSQSALSGTAKIRVLIGGEHDDEVLEARDKASKQITVLSHRLGVTAKPAIIIPAATAVRRRNVRVQLYYGRVSGPVKAAHANDARWKFSEQGVELIAVHRPKIHAKVLLWDDDNVVVTSLNWLSADTPHGNPRQEVGVGVRCARMAEFLRDEFDRLRAFSV